jgi:uncharacterized protein YjdB
MVPSLSYSVDSTKVVKVDSKGNVTGVSPGTTMVTISSKSNGIFLGATRAVSVQVRGDGDQIHVPHMEVSGATLQVGETHRLEPTLTGVFSEEPHITYRSTNSRVASVDADGTVHARATGNVSIYVTSEATATLASVTRIVPISVVRVIPEYTVPSTLSLSRSAHTAGSVAPRGGDAAELTVSYSSSNNGVATVDTDGRVWPVSVGSCTVTVRTAATGGYQATTRSVTVVVTE